MENKRRRNKYDHWCTSLEVWSKDTVHYIVTVQCHYVKLNLHKENNRFIFRQQHQKQQTSLKIVCMMQNIFYNIILVSLLCFAIHIWHFFAFCSQFVCCVLAYGLCNITAKSPADDLNFATYIFMFLQTALQRRTFERLQYYIVFMYRHKIELLKFYLWQIVCALNLGQTAHTSK